MFSTFGKMALLSECLHSHNYSKYTRLQICILGFIKATSQVYSFTFDEVTFKSLRLLHLNNFVTSISKHKISSSSLVYGLICLLNSMCVSMMTLWYVWCVFSAFYLMLLQYNNTLLLLEFNLAFACFFAHYAGQSGCLDHEKYSQKCYKIDPQILWSSNNNSKPYTMT